jgi:hypothetical protein
MHLKFGNAPDDTGAEFSPSAGTKQSLANLACTPPHSFDLALILKCQKMLACLASSHPANTSPLRTLAPSPRHGDTPAYVAGNAAVLRQLITTCVDPFCADNDGVIPLDRAGSCSHGAVVRLLVAADEKQNGPNTVLDRGKLVAGSLTHYVRAALQQRQRTFAAESDNAAAAAEAEAEAADAADGEADTAELDGAKNLVARVSALEAKWLPACQG